MPKKICFVMDASPEFLGGTSIYVLNFLNYLKTSGKKFNITLVYPGKEERTIKEDGVVKVELPAEGFFPFNFIKYAKNVKGFMKKNKFDFINSQAMAGYYLKKCKPEGLVTNTYHGVAYHFYKCHLGEKSLIKRLGAIYYMFFGYLLEKPPAKKADKVIGVSRHVVEELNKLYGKQVNKEVVRSSVNLAIFKKRDRKEMLKKLGLKEDKTYGLYVGRGGPWRKGLDRTISLSKEIMKFEENFELIIIGPSKSRENLKLIKSLGKRVTYIPLADREILSEYYSISDIFFGFSRYEGGAPILTIGEAMASGAVPICSRDAQQEIIENGKNGLIINNFGKKEAKKILNLINNKKKKQEIIKNNKKKIKEFSIKNWGKKYLEAITNEK